MGAVLPRLLFAAALGAALLPAACRPGEPPADTNGSAPAQIPPANQAAAPPAVQERLDREALLLAVAQARSAAAAGTDDREQQSTLDGARFELRIRLGCTIGPSGAAQPGLSAIVDQEARRVTLTAEPDFSLEHPFVAAMAAGRFEAAEGFWIPQPWLFASACPAQPPAPAGSIAAAEGEGDQPPPPPAAAAPPPIPPPGVGIVQFFTPDGSRLGRRDGRAYVAREEWPEGGPPPQPGSWELVISGRLRAVDGRAILCRADDPGSPPACLVAAEFDKVAIRNHVTGNELAQWSRG